MQSISGSGPLPAAPDPGKQTGRDTDEPRPYIVVENWVAPPAVVTSQSTHFSERRETRLRLCAAATVILLHGSLGAWLFLSHAEPQRMRAPEPLILLAQPQTHLPRMPILGEMPPPNLMPVIPTPPMPPQLSAAPVEIAVSIAPSSDVLISEARAGEVADLVGRCRPPAPQPVPQIRSAGEITLLVHVDKDGRVSDSKIEIGSGVPPVDEAIQRCLAARGLLTPRRINGSAVDSWQRVRWPAPSPGLLTSFRMKDADRRVQSR